MPFLPSEFVKSLRSLGHPAYDALPDVIANTAPTVSVRVNRARLNDCPFDGGCPVEWSASGYYLDARPDFTLDPRLHQGLYYVQDASSMAIEAAARRAADLVGDGRMAPLTVLDACAAPGGKTLAAIDALPHDSFVVANEYDRRRAEVLVENLSKWGVEACVTRGDASRLAFPKGFFNIVIADVPCSGEGMMRKDRFSIEQWSPSLVRECSELQRSIVDNLWDALAPDGVMIYSTCAINLDENERIVHHLISDLGAMPVDVPIESKGVLGAMGGYDFPAYRFVPGYTRGEGLFLAMVRKGGDTLPAKSSKPQKMVAGKQKSAFPFEIGDVLYGDYIVVDSDPIRVVKKSIVPFYQLISNALPLVSAGLEMGRIKGRDFIPSQQLALAHTLRRGYFPEAEVDISTALSYLRREAVVLPGGAPRGVVLLTYGGRPLGFVKNLGTRANNLYPDAWRIRNK